jgi:hypothetical protein
MKISIPKGTVQHHPQYAINYANGTAFYKVDLRLLERNRYAPWGRGEFGGKQVNK